MNNRPNKAPEGRHTIFGIPVWDISAEELFSYLFDCVKAKTGSVVGYVNPHACNLARKNGTFLNQLQSADCNFCDGHGVLWALRFFGKGQQHCWTLPDHIDLFLDSCEKNRTGLYFIGETRPDLEQFVRTVKEKHAELNITGYHHGFIEPSVNGAEIVEHVKKSRPDLVLIGTGMPRQEAWADYLRQHSGRETYFCVGALFKYYAGLEKRCPPFFSENGLEWLHRLCQHPVRYFGRYVTGNAFFVLRVLSAKICRIRSRGL